MMSKLAGDVGSVARCRGDAPVMRHALIVARDRPDLYEDFRLHFARSVHVEVFVDRRIADRRQRDERRIPNRRREQRRTSAIDTTAALWTEGYVIVRMA